MGPSEITTRARLELRRFVSPYPGVFVPLMRMRSVHGDNVINPSTEIMIEGAPRSGNTFAVAALEHAQGRPVSIARHLHGAGHVIEGIRRGVPLLVVCRKPRDAVTSQVIRHPEMTVTQALRQWITFYEPLLDHTYGFVVASFGQVTGDFGEVIRRVNDRFGTDFERFHHTDENVEAVFATVDEMDRQDEGRRAKDPEATTARPVESREMAKEHVRSRMEAPKVRTLMRHAEKIHDRFIRSNAVSGS